MVSVFERAIRFHIEDYEREREKKDPEWNFFLKPVDHTNKISKNLLVTIESCKFHEFLFYFYLFFSFLLARIVLFIYQMR